MSGPGRGGAGAAGATERSEMWPRAVIFDLDGTIADSFAAIQEALSAALAEFGMPARGLDWVRTHVGRGASLLMREAAAEPCSNELGEAILGRYHELYSRIYLERTPPIDGAREVLEFSSARSGMRVAIVSNKPASLCRPWLEYWGLAGLVAEVSGPDTSGALKPDPAAVRPTLDRLAVAAPQALMVGDMEIDALTAEAVGMPVVIVGGYPAARGWPLRVPLAGRLPELRGLSRWLVENGRGWG